MSELSMAVTAFTTAFAMGAILSLYLVRREFKRETEEVLRRQLEELRGKEMLRAARARWR